MGLILRLLPVLIALCGCGMKPVAWTPPPPGSFISANGSQLTDEHVAELATEADFVLVGENHTNPCDHAIQARVIELMARSGPVTIGLEMLPVTSQAVLDRFNKREIRLADLPRELDWNQQWGFDFGLYEPFFELAERLNLPVVALNIPKGILARFRDGGLDGLSPEERVLAPREIIEPSQTQTKALAEQMSIHQSMRQAGNQTAPTMPGMPMGADMNARFMLVQSLWDSTMANQAMRWRLRLRHPVVILAGAGHVEHGWGIEFRIRTWSPAAVCIGVEPLRDEEDFTVQTDPKQRALSGESIYFYCPAQHKSRLGMNILFGSEQIKVESVETGSPADKGGLKTGDILLTAGDKALETATDLHFAAMAASRIKAPLTLKVLRDREELFISIPLN